MTANHHSTELRPPATPAGSPGVSHTPHPHPSTRAPQQRLFWAAKSACQPTRRATQALSRACPSPQQPRPPPASLDAAPASPLQDRAPAEALEGRSEGRLGGMKRSVKTGCAGLRGWVLLQLSAVGLALTPRPPPTGELNPAATSDLVAGHRSRASSSSPAVWPCYPAHRQGCSQRACGRARQGGSMCAGGGSRRGSRRTSRSTPTSPRRQFPRRRSQAPADRCGQKLETHRMR